MGKDEKVDNTVITNSEKSINETLKIGQVVANGRNRIFEITNLTENDIELTSINGEEVKKSIMSRKVFSQLFYRRNYVQVKSVKTAVSEMHNSTMIGSNRFILK